MFFVMRGFLDRKRSSVLEEVRAPVAQLVEHRTVMREVAGSNPGRINTQDLKITEEKVLPLYFICKWLDFQVFSD